MTNYIRKLKKDFNIIKKRYESVIGLSQLSLAQALLKDGFFAIEKRKNNGIAIWQEFKSAKKEGLISKDKARETLSICEDLFTDGKLPSANEIISLLRDKSLSIYQCELLPFFICISLISKICYNLNNADILKNAIGSLHTFDDLDFDIIFIGICKCERLLLKDASGEYPLMSDYSKKVYRRAVAKDAAKTRKSEEAILTDALNESISSNRHIGFFLPLPKSDTKKGKLIIITEILLSVIASATICIITKCGVLLPLIYFPMYEITRLFADFLRRHIIKPSLPLSMEDYEEIPDDEKITVAISVILPSSSKISCLEEHLKGLYLSNKGENICYCVLADLPTAKLPQLVRDWADINAAKRAIDRLNKKYNNAFTLIVRGREYSKTENEYIGRERKRGAICDLVKYIKTGKHSFLLLYNENETIKSSKHLLALDQDTVLPFDAMGKILAVATHPINRPVIDYEKGKIIKGHGVFALKVETGIESANKTYFSSIFSGTGGLPAYTAGSGEKYYDLFGKSIFSGKGLINIDCFYTLLTDRFKNETVLSHDIPEGIVLNSSYCPNVVLTDSFPSNEVSYFKRLHRWIRGDIQNLPLIKSEKSMDFCGRFIILDNVRNAITPIAQVLLLLLTIFLNSKSSAIIAIVVLLSLILPEVLQSIRLTMLSGLSLNGRLYFSAAVPESLRCILKAAINIVMLSKNAICSLDAIAKALFRMTISKKHLLQWTTAAQGEAKSSNSNMAYYFFNFLIWLPLLIFAGSVSRLIAIFMLIFPFFSYFSARDRVSKSQRLSEDEKNTIISYGAAMWKYYERYLNRENNYLIPDNVQNSPIFAVAHRTSPTNIGLSLCAFLCAFDMGFISIDDLLSRLWETIASIEKLPKFRGNLYNWYDTKTLKPLPPAFVSSVDSGNFLCCLTAVSEGLKALNHQSEKTIELIEKIEKIRDSCDIAFLYDHKRRLFKIGYDTSTDKYSASYFDLLISESRLCGYYACARRLVSSKHWHTLSRPIKRSGRYSGLVSWSGTMFEYFMPYLFIPAFENTMLRESLEYCLFSQIKFAKDKKIPFGISESGDYIFDNDLNYQYSPHGITQLSIQNLEGQPCVVSPYSSFLTLPFSPHVSIKNLKALEKNGAFGEFGFYEAIDYSNDSKSIIRSFMAHHIGMSLICCANALFDNIFQKRFMAFGDMAGANSLLKERVVNDGKIVNRSITPEKSVKKERNDKWISNIDRKIAVFSNGEWSTFVSSNGTSAAHFCGKSVFKERNSPFYPDGVLAAVKVYDKVYSLTTLPFENSSGSCEFYSNEDCCILKNEGRDISFSQSIRIHHTHPCEIRAYVIKNKTKTPKKVMLTVYCEPYLDTALSKNPATAFSNMFIEINKNQKEGIFTFSRKTQDTNGSLYASLGFLNSDNISFCSDRESVISENSTVYSIFNNKLPEDKRSVDRCIAFQTEVVIPGKSSYKNTLIISGGVSKTAAENTITTVRRELFTKSLSYAKSAFKSSSLEMLYCEKILSRLLFASPLSNEIYKSGKENTLPLNALWEKGISGDYPIVLFNITEENPSFFPQFLTLYLRLKEMGITTECIFLTEHTDCYSSFLEDACKNQRVKFPYELIGKRGGVFIFKKSEITGIFKTLIEGLAVSIFPETEPALMPATTKIPIYKKTIMEENKFTNNGYLIAKKPFVPWSQVLANSSFGTLITDSSPGFTWGLNSRENKLTNHLGDTRLYPLGELLLLQDNNNLYDIISMAQCFFTKEYAKYTLTIDKMKITVTISVDAKALCKNIEVTIDGEINSELFIYYVIFPALSHFNDKPHLIKKRVEDIACTFENPLLQRGFGRLSSDAPCDFIFDSSSIFSFGINTLSDCIGAKRAIKDNKAMFYLSYGKSLKSAAEMPIIITKDKQTGYIKIATEDKELDFLFNDFLPSQILSARLFGRTGFYQVSGAYGFRDQLQDALSQALINPEILKKIILKCASAQFDSGDVLHWFHEFFVSGKRILRGIRTRCSDDMLWLPFAVSEYCIKTGDFKILRTPIPYLSAPELEMGENDRYGEYTKSDTVATLHAHCIKAIERVCKFGSHSLPLIGSCDWNDSFNMVGDDKSGESVWLGMFLCLTAKKYGAVCALIGAKAACHTLLCIAKGQNKSIISNAWSGDRFLRAFYSDGSPMGAENEKECAIDLLPQSFSVFANIGSLDMQKTAMDTAYNNLYHKESGVIRLFAPPFTQNGKRAGYVNLYPPGVRENGGQYTHAAVWFARGYLSLGYAQRGYELLCALNPAKKNIDIYKTEPYYLAGDVYYGDDLTGRGGWSIYTGSAAWYYSTVYEKLLGIRQIGGDIKIKPMIPLSLGKCQVEIKSEKYDKKYRLYNKCWGKKQ